jgi:hypothetical protein
MQSDITSDSCRSQQQLVAESDSPKLQALEERSETKIAAAATTEDGASDDYDRCNRAPAATQLQQLLKDCQNSLSTNSKHCATRVRRSLSYMGVPDGNE